MAANKPLLQQCRTAIPIERALAHDDFVLPQQLLFRRHIDEDRVFLIEVAKGVAIHLGHRPHQKRRGGYPEDAIEFTRP